MRRVPFDIQFLLESILSESPDNVLLSSRAASLVQNGAKIKAPKLNPTNTDSIAFYIDGKSKVISFTEPTGIHGYLEYVLTKAANAVVDDIKNETSTFEQDFREDVSFGFEGINYKNHFSGENISAYFFGLPENSIEAIKKYLHDNYEKLDKLLIRGRPSEEPKEFSGRVWTANNVISFWNSKEKIDPYMNLVIDFMNGLKMNPRECVYEFIDCKALFGYNDLSSNVGDREKRNKEEMLDLLRRQHLDPKAKRQLTLFNLENDPDFSEREAEKINKQREKNLYMPALEEHIKLKDLISKGDK